ncbi:MAG: acyltransferase [Methylophaga sp.]
MSFQQRQVGPDYAKIMGIILVVLGHTIRGLINAEILPADNAFWLNLDRAIYLFHMPLFFFLSGMFIQQVLAKTDLMDFFRRNVLIFIVPLIFWSYTQTGIQYFAASNVNVERSLAYVLQAPFPPKQQFWFLWALFLISCFSAVLLKLTNGKTLLTVLAVLALIVMSLGDRFGLSGVTYKMAGQTFGEAVFFFPYFVLGVLLTSPVVSRSITRFLSYLLLFAVIVTVYLQGYQESNGFYYVFSFITVFASYQCIVFIGEAVQSRLADNQANNRLLQNVHHFLIFIGMNSFIIYLAHIIPEAGIRVMLMQLGIIDPLIHVIAGTFFGLLAPLLLVPVNLLLVRHWQSANYIFPVRRMKYA